MDRSDGGSPGPRGAAEVLEDRRRESLRAVPSLDRQVPGYAQDEQGELLLSFDQVLQTDEVHARGQIEGFRKLDFES